MRRVADSAFVRSLTYASTRRWWFGWIINSILFALLVNLMSAWLPAAIGWFWTIVVMVLAAIIIGALSYYIFATDNRAQRRAEDAIKDLPNPSQCAGLILLISRAPIALPAIDYHKGALRHLWLIQTPESAPEADIVRSYAREQGAAKGRNVLVHDVEIPTAYATAECYAVVRRIIETEARDNSLSMDDLAADISGGTKSMTAAMVLACVATSADILEHVPSSYNVAAQPITPLNKPIAIRFQSAASFPEANVDPNVPERGSSGS